MSGFPSNPVNGQTTTVNNILYTYSVINNAWNKVGGLVQPVRVGLTATQINVIGTTALNGVSANGTLGMSGHVLTSNGSDTYWAPARDTNLEPIINELNEVIELDINAIFDEVLEQ